jgi:hypothetical protein
MHRTPAHANAKVDEHQRSTSKNENNTKIMRAGRTHDLKSFTAEKNGQRPNDQWSRGQSLATQ